MLDAYMQPGPIYITAGIMLAMAIAFFYLFVKVNRKRKVKYDAALAKYNKAMEELEKSRAAQQPVETSANEQFKMPAKTYERCIQFMSPTGSCFDILMNDTLTVGKNGRNNFHIDHASVADLHCKILYKDGKYYLQDLGSNFGTSFDGERIGSGSTVEIKNGLIQFGKVSFMMTLD